MLLSSICLEGMSERPLKKGGCLYTGGLHSQRQVSICRLPKEDGWVMTKGRDRAWDWAEAVLLRHQDVQLSCAGRCRENSSELRLIYSLFTFTKAKALMHHTFQENQKTNILWKLSRKWWCHDGWRWICKSTPKLGSQRIASEHWPWKVLFARALLDLQPSFIIFTDTVQTRPTFFHFTSPYGS